MYFVFQVELHVHLDGAIRPETILDIAKYVLFFFIIFFIRLGLNVALTHQVISRQRHQGKRRDTGKEAEKRTGTIRNKHN